MRTIKINNKEYPLGGRIRALLVWEAATQRPFELKLVSDTLLYYYSMLLAGADMKGEEIDLDYSQFLDAYDSDPSVAVQFATVLADAERIDRLFNSGGTQEEGKKKDLTAGSSSPS